MKSTPPDRLIVDGDNPFNLNLLCNSSIIENTIVKWALMDNMRECLTNEPEVWIPIQYRILMGLAYGLEV